MLSQDGLCHPTPQVFLAVSHLMLIPLKSGPAWHIPGHQRKKPNPDSRKQERQQKNNETSRNISPNETAAALNDTEDVSRARAPGNNHVTEGSAQVPRANLCCVSHCQSNSLQAVAQTGEGEATSPHSLNRAVEKLKPFQIPNP